MIETLSRAFLHLESQKSLLLSKLAAMPDSALQHKPTAAEWSALEIADHLVRTESGIVAAAIEFLPQRVPVPASDRIRGRMIEWLFRTPAKVKVPPTVSEVLPGHGISLEAVAARWTETRLLLRETLESATPESCRLGAFRHPVAGWMDLSQTLRFFSVHIIHHQYQLRRFR